MNITLTPESCVRDTDMRKLAQLPREIWLVSVCGTPKTKGLVRLEFEELGVMLACPITGTLYNPRTGRTSDPALHLLQPIAAEGTA